MFKQGLKKLALAGLLSTFMIPVLPAATHAAVYQQQNSNRVDLNFNTAWQFFGSNIPNGQDPYLDESGAQAVNLPHSNSLLPLFDVTPSAWQTVNWYRRHFSLAELYNGRRITVEFQGAGQINKVYVNGKLAGEGRGVHTSFTIDITEYVKYGNFDNVIAVQVDNQGHADTMPYNGDFYTFGGIHGDVKLHMTDPVYAYQPYYVTTPNTTSGGVEVTGSVMIRNENPSGRNVDVTASLVDANGEVVASSEGPLTIDARGEQKFSFVQHIANPHLWTINDPYLYAMKVQTRIGTAYVDEQVTNVGLKWVAMVGDPSAKTSKFYLNGVETKLVGYDKHNQAPYLGNSGPNRLQRKDARTLKYELGANVVRTSHYTNDPEFLDEADKIGLLVEEEAFGMNDITGAQRPIFENSLSSMIYRDRNHPSIIMWSVLPNESNSVNAWHSTLNAIAKNIDPSRPTVQEMISDSYMQVADVYASHNYATGSAIFNATHFPQWIGEYNNGLGSSFVIPGDSEARKVRQLTDDAMRFQQLYSSPQTAGVVHWESFGYLTPLNTNTFGKTMYDYRAAGVTGPYRDALNKYWLGYFYQSQQSPSQVGNVLYIANEWKSDSDSTVYVISNAAKVALFRNGVSLGKIAPNMVTGAKQGLFKFTGVNWAPGSVLEARSYDSSDTLLTTYTRYASAYDNAASLKLNATTGSTVEADGSDVAWLMPELLDANGQRSYYGDANVRIRQLTGPGTPVFAPVSGSETLRMTDGLTGFYVRSLLNQPGAVMVQAEADLGTTVNDSVYGAGDSQFNYAGPGWTIQVNKNGRFNGDEHVAAAGASGANYADMTFTGTQIRLYGTKASGLGQANVTVDGVPAGTVDYKSTYGEIPSQLIYTSEELPYGTHTIRITSTGGSINLDRAKVMDGEYELASNVVTLNAVTMSEPTVPVPSVGSPKVTAFPNSVVLQAEETSRSAGAVIATADAGYNGTGYIDMKNNEGTIEWTVAVTTSGRYPLQFRYKNSGADRKLDVSINNTVVVKDLPFMETGTTGSGDSPWGVMTTTPYLKAGINKIKLTSKGSSISNMDQLEILGLPQPPAAPAPHQFTLEAENAVFSSTAAVATLGNGWSGTGFVNFKNSAGSITFTLNVPAENDYMMNVQYAYGSGGSAAMKMTVDGVVANPSISFPSTGNWNTTWGSIAVPTHLTAGTHSIVLDTVGTTFINVDLLKAIEVTVPPTPATFDQTLQAEDAVRSAGIVGALGSGWNGTGYVNFSGGEGYVEWAASTPEANYTLSFTYANGGGNRPMKLWIDGQAYGSPLDFPSTGNWNTTWGTVSVTADLSSGTHTLRLTTTGASGPNLDKLQMKEN